MGAATLDSLNPAWMEMIPTAVWRAPHPSIPIISCPFPETPRLPAIRAELHTAGWQTRLDSGEGPMILPTPPKKENQQSTSPAVMIFGGENGGSLAQRLVLYNFHIQTIP